LVLIFQLEKEGFAYKIVSVKLHYGYDNLCEVGEVTEKISGWSGNDVGKQEQSQGHTALVRIYMVED